MNIKKFLEINCIFVKTVIMKKIVYLLLLIPFYNFSQSGYYNDNKSEISQKCDFYRGNNFASNLEADKALDRILNVTGMSKSFVLYPCSNIDNCIATSYKGIRYIIYDKYFMQDIANNTTSWSKLSILAHEVGHHVNGHSMNLLAVASVDVPTLKESREMELEADEYSGFIMQKLGATLSQAQAAINKYTTDRYDTYSTHPSKYKRLKAIERGYNKAKAKYVGEWKDGKKHGQGTLTWANGRKYVGEFKDGKYHGKGTFTYPDGTCLYVGEFKDGKMQGQGTYTNVMGHKYVGEWMHGKKNGQGTETWANGGNYVGEWKDGKMNGQGTMSSKDGIIKIGLWENNRFIVSKNNITIHTGCNSGNCCKGFATYVFSKGEWKWCKYVGEFKDCKMHGKGTLTYPDGTCLYVGEWKDGKFYGQGTYMSSNGTVKQGLWENNRFIVSNNIKTIPPGCNSGNCQNGYGTRTYPRNGDKYIGRWLDGKKHGAGTYIYASGNKYVGEWKDDKQHGQGTFTYNDGAQYLGEYKNGNRDGQGTYTFANRSKYVGGFKDDMQNGQGTYTFGEGELEGAKYVGEWKDNKNNGQGTFTYANGVKYVGEWKDGKKYGEGTYTYVDGKIESGYWKKDKFKVKKK
jgi:hypothetical protein